MLLCSSDFVRVNADGIDEQLFCGDNNEARLLASDLYNNGKFEMMEGYLGRQLDQKKFIFPIFQLDVLI